MLLCPSHEDPCIKVFLMIESKSNTRSSYGIWLLENGSYDFLQNYVDKVKIFTLPMINNLRFWLGVMVELPDVAHFVCKKVFDTLTFSSASKFLCPSHVNPYIDLVMIDHIGNTWSKFWYLCVEKRFIWLSSELCW